MAKTLETEVKEFFDEYGEQVLVDFGTALDEWKEEQNNPKPIKPKPPKEEPNPACLTVDQKKTIVQYFLDTSVKGLFEDGIIELEKEEDYESYKLAVYMLLEEAQDVLNSMIDVDRL